MKLLVGLGNPGREYVWTRHNAGFWIVDVLAGRAGARFQTKGSGEVSSVRLGGESVVLLKPRTYMNRSGFAVVETANFYRIAEGDILVLHDDVDLAPGRLKLKIGGGAGGHKGVISTEEQLGNREFARLRFGVGRPEHPGADTADFVLARIPEADRAAWLDHAGTAADAAECWVREGLAAAQNRFHRDGPDTADAGREKSEGRRDREA